MHLRFFALPAPDLEAACAFYQALGMDISFADEGVAGVAIPGSDTRFLLDPDITSPTPILVVDDAVAFFEQNRDRLDFIGEPFAIGPGMMASFTDPGGTVVRVMDDSTSNERADSRNERRPPRGPS